MSKKKRVLLLIPTKNYRASAFLTAAAKLDIKVIVGSEKAQTFEKFTDRKTITLDLAGSEKAADKIAELSVTLPIDAILPTDDNTAVVAAEAARRLGLPFNSPAGNYAAQAKHKMREKLSQAELPSPDYQILSTTQEPRDTLLNIQFPCVLKPVFLSASRGVIKADNREQFIKAFRRIKTLLEQPDIAHFSHDLRDMILVESFIPGKEVALEGILQNQHLKTLAIFDKPDPLNGPYFEETIYVTPSRHSQSEQKALQACVETACKALDIRYGPVHAEMRINKEGVWLVEIASRSIGGLCGKTLLFENKITLEELILRHALGEDISNIERENRAAGVMMLPIPKAGILKDIIGIPAAMSVTGIEDVRITIPKSQKIIPLPEGDRYLGFIFARNAKPGKVEASLREAHQKLHFIIE